MTLLNHAWDSHSFNMDAGLSEFNHRKVGFTESFMFQVQSTKQ